MQLRRMDRPLLLVTAAQGGRNHVWPVMIANDP